MTGKPLAMTPALRAAVLNAMTWTHRSPAGYAAKPYVDAVLSVPMGATGYGDESLRDVVMYLRSNLRSWRGPLAKEVKAELDEVLAA